VKVLMRRVDDDLKRDIVMWAAHYVGFASLSLFEASLSLGLVLQEHRLKIGSKAIFHIEAFVAKFMSLYKRWLVNQAMLF